MRQKIKFYMDEHVSKAVVQALRRRGVDTLSVVEAGMMGASDEEHLNRAKTEQRVIFTQDDDFLRLHANGIKHAGIVYVPQQTRISEIIQGLMLVYQVLDAGEMQNHVEYL
jgi:predicted nuclease of predicted toxin-antitoxin system